MARRRRSSAFDDFIEVASRMPWWICLALALLAYGVLHHFALTIEAAPKDLKGLGSYVGRAAWLTAATLGQYLIPAGLVFAAVLSAIRARRNRNRFVRTAALGTQSALSDLSWQAFEGLVGEFFRRQGFQVMETGGGPDGGVDLKLRRGSEHFLVQCKQWRATRVGVDVVRELYGVMAAEGATGAYVVSSGRFTPDAMAFVEGRNITLVDGQRLVREMQGMSSPKPTDPQRSVPVAVAAGSPPCPTCGSLMVVRMAQKGANAGNRFWGCSTYPRCKRTLALRQSN